MEWVQQNLVLVLIGAALIIASIWWLIGSSRTRSPEAVTRDGVEKEISPVIMGMGAAPADVPPAVEAVPAPVAPAPPVAAPAPAPAPAVAATDDGPADDLTRMKGVGPKVAALLNELGVTRFAQIAGWSDDDIARIDTHLGAFRGRAVRDRWVEQARLLAAGDTAAYEAAFGRLG
jgi:predicted flap endonuclease-1-like 5' DNA nuclease